MEPGSSKHEKHLTLVQNFNPGDLELPRGFSQPSTNLLSPVVPLLWSQFRCLDGLPGSYQEVDGGRWGLPLPKQLLAHSTVTMSVPPERSFRSARGGRDQWVDWAGWFWGCLV